MCPNPLPLLFPETAKFCSECGYAPQHSPPEPAPVSIGGRRHLTVMYCDIVNSIRVSEEIDPEELRDYLREYQETCASVIRRFDGHVAKYLGDGLLVHFGYPTAHEDDAQRAVRAGLGMLEALHRSDFQGPRGQVTPVEIRIGIDTGLVVIDQILGLGSQRSESEQTMEIFGETPEHCRLPTNHRRARCALSQREHAPAHRGIFRDGVPGSSNDPRNLGTHRSVPHTPRKYGPLSAGGFRPCGADSDGRPRGGDR